MHKNICGAVLNNNFGRQKTLFKNLWRKLFDCKELKCNLCLDMIKTN